MACDFFQTYIFFSKLHDQMILQNVVTIIYPQTVQYGACYKSDHKQNVHKKLSVKTRRNIIFQKMVLTF